MSVQQINGYIGGIRDEFVLEAEPRALAALTPKDGVILSSPAGRSRRGAKRWIPLIVAAAIAVNIDAKNMKLVSALIVAAAISYPAIRDKVLFYRKRREANRNV